MNLLLTEWVRLTDEQVAEIHTLGYEVTVAKGEPLPPEILAKQDVLVGHGGFLHQHLSELSKVRMIQLVHAGLDWVPLAEVKKRGIILLNARGVFSIPIAEWVIMKILEIYKDTRFFEENQRQARWQVKWDLLELTGKTVGVIGTGSIGREVAKMLRAFNCRVLGLNTTGKPKEHFDQCRPVTAINEFLPLCDVLVLTLPLTDKSKHLICRETLALMKENAVLVNIARGGIINEEDLLNHLAAGKLKGVALDVFAKEPLPTDSPFWSHPRVHITPHNTSFTDQMSRRMFELIYGNLLAYKENGDLRNRIKSF